MKKALIMELEDLLNAKDDKDLQYTRKLIESHAYADSDGIMEQVDLYITTRSTESRNAIERIIASLSNS